MPADEDPLDSFPAVAGLLDQLEVEQLEENVSGVEVWRGGEGLRRACRLPTIHRSICLLLRLSRRRVRDESLL